MLCFVDNITMIADNKENLERILLNIDKALKQDYNMKIKKAKKKI